MTKVINNVEAIEAIDHIQKCNLPCLLLGETGTGKTTLVKAVAEKYGRTLTRINLNGQTGREELLGKYVLIGGETKRQDGPLLTALKHGHWILLDEINAALPEVLFTIQALTESIDGKLGNLLLAEHDGEVVVPHEDCRIFGTANPSDKYVGTKAFNPATLSRFVVIEIHNLSSIDERKLLKERYPKVAAEVLTKLVKIGAELRKATTEDKIEFFCSTRELVNATALINSGLAIEIAIKIAILNKVQSKFELADVKAIIDPIVMLPDSVIEEQRDSFINTKEQLVKLTSEMGDIKSQLTAAETELDNRAKTIIKLESDIKTQQGLLDKAKEIVEKFSKAATLFSTLPAHETTSGTTKNPDDSTGQPVGEESASA